VAQRHLTTWERLFARALQVVDAAQRTERQGIVWTLGGGSALMRRHRHRRSAGVDLFVRDPRMLREAIAGLAFDHVEESNCVRIYFPEGEAALIASGLHVSDPVRREWILGRPVLVETSSEILAKKLVHRAASLPARDLFDFAAVAAFEPDALRDIGGVLRARRGVLLERLRRHPEALREDFAALDAWEFHPRFEECVGALHAALRRSLPPVVEQERCAYEVARPGVCHRNRLARPSASCAREMLQAGEIRLPNIPQNVAAGAIVI
jgi:hypothetical protein